MWFPGRYTHTLDSLGGGSVLEHYAELWEVGSKFSEVLEEVLFRIKNRNVLRVSVRQKKNVCSTGCMQPLPLQRIYCLEKTVNSPSRHRWVPRHGG